MDTEEVTTIKVLKTTRRLAKILAAHCGLSLFDLLHKLVIDEIKRRGLVIE